MVKNFDDLQQVSKDNVDVTLKAMGALSKGTQAIAVEVADYSKKAFEDGTAALEKLFGVKSFDKAIEVQTDTPRPPMRGLWPRLRRSVSCMPISPRKPTSRSKSLFAKTK